MSSHCDLRQLLKPNDHIILDRGFRDAIDTLQNKYQLITHMPTCKAPNQKQLTTERANTSRLTTKVRYMVEVVNGKLSTLFRSNSKIHRNVTLTHALDDYRIAGAIINKFYTLHTPNANDINIATSMKNKLTSVNRLDTILANHHIDRARKNFQKMTASSIPDFPHYTLDHIANNITFGPYSIKQAQGYIKENFKTADTSIIEVYQDNNNVLGDNTTLLRAKVQSRHKNSKQYFTYITYDTTPTINNDTGSIQDWICTCHSGKRTMGPCAHATSVISFLSHDRYCKHM